MKKLSTTLLAVSLVGVMVGVNGFAADTTTTTKKAPAKPAARATGAPTAAPKQHGHAPIAAQRRFVRNYGMAGCGLGAMVMGKKDNQVFAATTNGTFGNQTFGITFGTLNCVDSTTTAMTNRMDGFVAANKAAIASDMARGEGETLKTLASLMGCDADLGASMQKNFKTIFPSTDVQSGDVTDSIITVIQNDSELSSKCKQVG